MTFPTGKNKKLVPGSKQERMVFFASFVLFVSFTFLDLYTKYLISSRFYLGQRIKILDGFFDLTFITNTGASFGMFPGMKGMLLGLSIFAFIFLSVFYRKLTEGWPERYFLVALLLSGVAGNTIDRFIDGKVVDFLLFYVGKWYWPAFNVADTCICVSVTFILISTWIRPSQNEERKE